MEKSTAIKRVVRTPDYPIVSTSQGKLHGYLQGEVFHFPGIRYGLAERFCLPEAEKPWTGIRDAKSYGYICPLMPDNMAAQTSLIHDPSDIYNLFAPPFSSFEMPHVYWPMSEQCLYLNVWTKHIDSAAKKPVLVWLHGGGLAAGSSNEIPAYDGTNLCDYGDLVLVSINHRLNCIGFLDLSSFGDKFKHSGILGMADIVLALSWVKENIAAFGGDPDNVTVAGQSGGGNKTLTLLQMPVADGLYHKVISQSGYARNYSRSVEEEKEYRQSLGKKTAELLGLNEDTIDQIRTIPYEQLSKAVEKAGKSLQMPEGLMLFEPSPVEGYFEGTYSQAGFRPETVDIPVIAGTVLGEFSFMHYLGDKNAYSPEDKMRILRECYKNDTDEIVSEFRKIYPDLDILYALSVDSMFRIPTLSYLNARDEFIKKEGKGAGCWNYMMNFIIPYLGGTAPWHCSCIPFVFRNVGMEPAHCTGTDYAERLENEISDAWLAFTRTGSPSTAKAPWENYHPDTHARMIFAENSRMDYSDDKKLLKLTSAYMH